MTERIPILVVDDSPAICRAISEVLAGHGYDISMAHSGLDAISAAKIQKFALITLDVEMPGMAGIETLRILKAYDPDLFVIMVSGLSALQTALQAIRQGAYDYINKPFDPEDMLLSVQRALRQRALLLENRKLIEDLRTLNENLEGIVKQRRKELEDAHAELRVNHDKLEQAYTKLQELDKLKAKFITIASHELRTPLTSIRGYVDFLTKNRNDAERQARAIEGMERNLRRLTTIVTEITDVAKLREKQLVLNKELAHPRELIDTVLQEMLPFVETRKQFLESRISETLPQVLVDSARIRQVLCNLIMNAIRFTPDEGRICISVERESAPGTFVKFSVSDTGIGISDEEKEKIFDDFYESIPWQHHHSGTIQFQSGGIGLGLSVVKGIIEEHNGRIWVESSRSTGGSGSTFHFLLPEGH